MSSSRKIDQRAGREINRRLVMNLLRESGPLSRSQIASATELSAAATGFVVNDLIAEGLLVETAPQKARPGRRPVPVALNLKGPLAIGLKLSLRRIDLILTDLGLSVIAQRSAEIASNAPEDFVAGAQAQIAELLSLPEAKGRPVIGLGLTMPARLDVSSGSCVNSHRFGWKDVPIAALFSEALGYPVAIEDDTLAYGLAHQLFGLGRGERNFLALAVGQGIGCAPIVDGHVRRGELGNAGKVGHLRVTPDGPLCECGRAGCLQAHYSASSLERRWSEQAPSAPALPEAVRTGDPRAVALVAEAGEQIGHHLASWVLLLDPRLIILGGEAAVFGEIFTDPMRRAMTEGHYKTTVPQIIADDGRFYWTSGAAAVALRHIFNGHD